MASSSVRNSAADDVSKARTKLPKKLIVCCDGTWMDRDNGWVKGSFGDAGHLQHPSNVTRITRAIKSEDDSHHPQIVYYQSGIGTSIGLYDHLVGGATGVGLSENIREAYSFLASNYATHDPLVEPDSIFLLGFSRGAYTARSLGGFIAAVGILTKEALPHFYECFLDWEHAGDPHWTPLFFKSYVEAHPDKSLDLNTSQPPLAMARAKGAKQIDQYMAEYRKHLLSLHLTQEAPIQGIGVWDTVGALGIPINPLLQRVLPMLPSFIRTYRWFDTRLDPCIKNAFQALGLDEHRSPYSPAVWELNDGNKTTNLKQVWFPGAHSNIGGSYPDYGMADITLAWMMDQLSGKHVKPNDFDAAKWIRFSDEYIDECFRHTTRHHATHFDGAAHQGWAMGKVYNSCTFPQSLLGKRVRTPGRYHKTNYDTGNYTRELLHNTNEYIHSSARARIDLGGRGVEPYVPYQKVLTMLWRFLTMQTKHKTYQPQCASGLLSARGPLHDWKLVDGHASHVKPNYDIDVTPDALDAIEWRYQGTDVRPDSITVLPEDALAADGYERRLLEHDRQIADQVVFSNHHWRWPRKPSIKKLLAHTF